MADFMLTSRLRNVFTLVIQTYLLAPHSVIYGFCDHSCLTVWNEEFVELLFSSPTVNVWVTPMALLLYVYWLKSIVALDHIIWCHWSIALIFKCKY